MNIDISSDSIAQSLEINARYDLQAPYVRVRYETTNTIQGRQSLQVVTDQYPDPLPSGDPQAAFAGLDFTVDLQGANVSQTQAKITVDPVNALAPDVNAQLAWWLGKHPQYTPNNPASPDPTNTIGSVTIIPGSVVRVPTNAGDVDAGYTNELTTGQIAPWMNFGAQRVTFKCTAEIVHRNGTTKDRQPLTYQCVVTNANSGAYNNTVTNAYAEPIPEGLAQFMYAALNPLQFEGSVILQEEDCSGSILIGNVLNLINGNLSEWATMISLIQEVEENLDTGQTTLHFGPPKHLTAGELVDLLRINRNRHIYVLFSMQQQGTPGNGGGTVTLGQNTPEKNSSSTTAPPLIHVISSTIDGSDPVVAHQSAPDGSDSLSYWGAQFAADQPLTAPAGQANAVVIRLSDAQGNPVWIQPMKVCVNGVPGTIYFLCSKFIPDP